MRWVVLVNGPPGSGKTTLARGLAPVLDLPLLSKDAVKETLLDHLGFADREESRRIGAASGEVLWTILRDSPTAAVVESWLSPSIREVVLAGLRRAAVDLVVEIWCACPPEEVTRRYGARRRHPGHFDDALVDDLPDLLVTAQPLGLGEVISVATDRPVDVHALASRVRALVAARRVGDEA
jgi:predicted kinase